MATSTTLLSLAEFQDLPDNGMRHELSEGELIEMPPPKYLHSHVAHRFFEVLLGAARTQTRGRPFVEAGCRLSSDPPTVRQPDVSFVNLERLSATPEDDWIEGAPELAIEVVSPSDTAEDLNRKIGQHLAAGASAVWVAYPKTSQIHVHCKDEPVRILGPQDRLDERTLFPGWSAPVSEFF